MSPVFWPRRLALLALTIVGCLLVFALARWLALQPDVALPQGESGAGLALMAESPHPQQQPAPGMPVVGVQAGTATVPWHPDASTASLRWIMDDADRAQIRRAWQGMQAALAQGRVVFVLADGRETAPVTPTARGWAALGPWFWLFAGYALVLWLVGGVVVLLRPQWRNVIYLGMVWVQAVQLGLAAISAVPALVPPGVLASWGASLSEALDLITCSALLHAAATHPKRLPHHRLWAAAAWLSTAFCITAVSAGALPHGWWWTQGLLWLQGSAALVLLTWSLHIEPHPFAYVMRRVGVLLWLAVMLLMAGYALRGHLRGDPLPLMHASALAWNVLTASVVVLVPFLAHSQRLMRSLPIVVGTAALAMLADLILVAVFNLGPLAAMAGALLLALSTYAALSQWILNQAANARTVATERMFEHLYRVARDVETRPERARQRMTQLLEHVFEPLDAQPCATRGKRSQLTGNGAGLAVPMPAPLAGEPGQTTLALRGADRGRRLFTPDDARLADRIVEQLMRAVAQDRAVERGRAEERTRIAQDLHDDIGARLLTLMYKAPTREMENYVRHTLQDLKTLTRGLAAQSQPLSLAAAEWKRDLTDRAALAGCTLDWHSQFDREVTLTNVEWSSLTRIVRELVSNVIAHAQATHAQIDCRLEDGQLFISCADNGQGTDPASWSRGLGVGGIRKRVRLLGGEVQWRTQQPHGIVCDVYIPRLSGSTSPV